MEHKIVTVIQARMGSSRLPGKVLQPLAGKPALLRMVERVSQAKLSGTLVVATTDEPHDDVLADLCERENIRYIRGHSTDLLDRHYNAGLSFGADSIVKIPSDCPLIDPRVIDKVLAFYLNRLDSYDFVSNLHPATYPDGNDVEVMTMQALKAAWENADEEFEREHTTPYIWDNVDKFRVGNVTWESGHDYSMTHRWTLDYEEDYRFISAIYDGLFYRDPVFGLDDILHYLEKNPEIAAINERYNGVNWYRDHLHQLKTITKSQTVQVGA